MSMAKWDHAGLNAQAKATNPRVQRWVGKRSGSARTRYICWICDSTIDTESSKWPMTKHAQRAIEAHMAAHLGQEVTNV